jgi:hypothetical protein
VWRFGQQVQCCSWIGEINSLVPLHGKLTIVNDNVYSKCIFKTARREDSEYS